MKPLRVVVASPNENPTIETVDERLVVVGLDEFSVSNTFDLSMLVSKANDANRPFKLTVAVLAGHGGFVITKRDNEGQWTDLTEDDAADAVAALAVALRVRT